MNDGKTCKICDKKFTRRNYLLKHMEKLHSKRYSCPTCFRFLAGPTEHSCASKDGRFVCYVDGCPLKFSNGMSLRLHIRDGHKKIDENFSGTSLKTKKEARDMVKMLCKKINMLSKCFDELKYHVDSISDFLSHQGYQPVFKRCKDQLNSQREGDGHTKEDDIDMDYYNNFIEEESIELEEEISIEKCEERHAEPKRYEESKNCVAILQVEEIVPKENEMNRTSFKFEPSNVQSKPQIIKIPTISSKIIQPIPMKVIHLRDHIAKPTNDTTIMPQLKPLINAETETIKTKNEKTTPPIFLKIETEVTERDPKITFHFDTSPPDQT